MRLSIFRLKRLVYTARLRYQCRFGYQLSCQQRGVSGLLGASDARAIDNSVDNLRSRFSVLRAIHRPLSRPSILYNRMDLQSGDLRL